MDYIITLCGICFIIPVKTRYTYKRISSFIEKNEDINLAEYISVDEISEYDEELDSLRPGVRELTSLIIPISDHLLKYNCCVIHGLSFSWRNKGFLFCGPSGVGKTTQYQLWETEYGDEIAILNGDKPILEQRREDQFILHPSPWTGKEDLYSYDSKQLYGIIYLEQGTENNIVQINDSSIVLSLLQEIFYSARTVNLVDNVASIIHNLLTSVPIWKLTNKGDTNSVILTHEVLEEFYRY